MKWYLQNSFGRLSFALRNPRYAFRSVLRDLAGADERFLASLAGLRAAEIRGFLHEPANLPWFSEHLWNCAADFKRLEMESANLYAKKVLLQYVVARALRPNVILETGVASGVSTAYLLLALETNGNGILHSIGDANPVYLPPGRSPGWIVPQRLASRWKLHLGKTEELFPGVFSAAAPLDIFIHDSLHTYEHMLFEYRAAYPHLRPGGILISDDALWNPAFREFSAEVRAPLAQVLRGVGFLKKNPS